MTGPDAALVASRYTLGERPSIRGPVARGELGQVWRLETTSGTYAVKQIFEPMSESDVRPAADFQDVAVAAGVPAPAVVRSVAGDVLTEIDARVLRVYSWVDVAPPDTGLDPAALGAVVASIHRLRHPAAGPVRPWYTRPVGRRGWTDLTEQLLARGCPGAEALLGQREELIGLEELLEEPVHLLQLHLDLWADNVRATPSGALSVLDWDNAGPGDPSQELAAVLFEYCSGSPGRARQLHEAYVGSGGPGRVVRPGSFSMAIAQLGNILAWQGGNWLRAGSPEQRAHAAEAIDEFVLRPLTRDAIDELVEAVT